ncbi:hypothetical protein OPT61_g3171 [Boeremia exigua]|uniref:Uncharacterized protein n=1 Tax=Boeremia exigua TaxID=749465 RepID=A0ACC2IJ08_9PLEO|nr:hypothetical protein OPT61_g3171 [Boeremia exigua]
MPRSRLNQTKSMTVLLTTSSSQLEGTLFLAIPRLILDQKTLYGTPNNPHNEEKTASDGNDFAGPQMNRADTPEMSADRECGIWIET